MPRYVVGQGVERFLGLGYCAGQGGDRRHLAVAGELVRARRVGAHDQVHRQRRAEGRSRGGGRHPVRRGSRGQEGALPTLPTTDRSVTDRAADPRVRRSDFLSSFVARSRHDRPLRYQPAADWAKSQQFYDAVLGVLGFSRQMDFGVAIGYGRDGKPDLIADASAGEASGPNREVHFAFPGRGHRCGDRLPRRRRRTRRRVAARAPVVARIPPRLLRCVVRDPDGNNVEAVFHGAAG